MIAVLPVVGMLKYGDKVKQLSDGARRGNDARAGINLPTIRNDVALSGGRSGQDVKNLKGPPNSAVRGANGRVYVTNDKGEVIFDITKDRVKPVRPGQGFGPKRPPTPEELDLINKLHRGDAQ
jgi:hypothetical protein